MTLTPVQNGGRNVCLPYLDTLKHMGLDRTYSFSIVDSSFNWRRGTVVVPLRVACLLVGNYLLWTPRTFMKHLEIIEAGLRR